MPRRHVLLLSLLATTALAAPSAAQAKQVEGLTACGADGCRTVDRAIGRALQELGGAAIARGPRPAPHFRLAMRIGDGHRTLGTNRVVYVPSSRAIGGRGGWSRLDHGVAAKLARALAGRSPLPARDLPTTVAALAVPGTSLPPEVVPPPAGRPAAADDGGFPWWVLGAGGLAVVAAALLRRRRRGRLTLA